MTRLIGCFFLIFVFLNVFGGTFLHGENVYLSRIILKAMGDTTAYFNDCEYENIEAPGKSLIDSNIESFTSIYPNPAKTEVTIETDMVLPATFNLYTLLGEEVFSVELISNQSVISISGIQSQLLMYVIQSSNGDIHRGTLTIIE